MDAVDHLHIIDGSRIDECRQTEVHAIGLMIDAGKDRIVNDAILAEEVGLQSDRIDAPRDAAHFDIDMPRIGRIELEPAEGDGGKRNLIK